MAKLTALFIAGAVATAGLSQAAFAQATTPSMDLGLVLSDPVIGNPSTGSGDANGPAVGNGGQMSISTPSMGAPVQLLQNPSDGSGDVNGPATGNGGDFNSAGQRAPEVTQDPSHGNGDVNGPATGNGGDMGSATSGQ